MTLTYHVTALQITVYFNKHGDHDHNGLIYVLTQNLPILKYIRALAKVGTPEPPDPGDTPEMWLARAQARANLIGVELPSDPAEARMPHPLVRPLVLRARKGDNVRIRLHNEIRGRKIGLHLVGDGYDVKKDDGSHIGRNPSSLTPYNGNGNYTWECRHEGVFPFHDGGDYDGGEAGTNVHGLFGALIVEPQGSIWRDPVSGIKSIDMNGNFRELDGLYLDVLPPKAQTARRLGVTTTLENHKWCKPKAYPTFEVEAHREFVIFFHDEPEFLPSHTTPPPPYPCGKAAEHGSGHVEKGVGHGAHDLMPIMPVSYRAEPMINREHILWERINRGDPPNPPVLNEEQHHSSWMFGDPSTPVLKAYIGDPVRIRFVHAGVKETHVFHLHLYEWHAVFQDKTSPRIDAISVSPQTGHTIEPVWGAGNRHQVAGDIIWHCHLYPHFHEGMWGMFRTFETLQSGIAGDFLDSADPVYGRRRIGLYPDGTVIEKLLPLPDRDLPPFPTPQHPGFPLYIPGTIGEKSPRPPWPNRDYQPHERRVCGFRSLKDMPVNFDYRPVPTDLERNAFNERPVPGELFTRNRFRSQQHKRWKKNQGFRLNKSKEVCREIIVDKMRIDYNDDWYDQDGHLYYLATEGHPDTRSKPKEPLFFRANHGQIVNVVLKNQLPLVIEKTKFDPRFPPCRKLGWEGECATHVHMVKFDPVCADGASTGWNYISAPRPGKKMVYRWWADKEFGTIFFHDHLFANYRQKHGLFGAMLVEPKGAEYFDPFSNKNIISGLQARIKVPATKAGEPPYRWSREFCIGIADFIPMWNGAGRALNPPDHPGGHGDQGVMGLNYRNAPIRQRGEDPEYWFSSFKHGDPPTTIFETFPNDPIWLRVVQGSHEEQHSFQIHGMRWRRFRANADSTVRSQQTFGLSEAFTFVFDEPYAWGDYLYKLSGADDLWLGCWGIIRALDQNQPNKNGLLPLEASVTQPTIPLVFPIRRFRVEAHDRELVYRNGPRRLTDPFGLIFRVTDEMRPGESFWRPVVPASGVEPLILRCRKGEQVEVTVHNRFRVIAGPEPFAPQVPLEKLNRRVSQHVSLHADLLRYDVKSSDGANIGFNPEQTIPQSECHTYTWYAVLPAGARHDEPLGPVLLQDMADFRNHRHHGLVGALIVEDHGAVPYVVNGTEMTAAAGASEAWHGSRATIVKAGKRIEEIVLLLQDGLRLFRNGETDQPLPDFPPDTPPGEMDKEDQGQKAFNYRTEPVGNFDPGGRPDILGVQNPATPIFRVPVHKPVHFHLIGASDKPRNYSFTIHGVTWQEYRFLSTSQQLCVASESAISCGSTRTFEFTPEHTGDHAYRSGMLSWAVHQGLWGILRVGSSSNLRIDRSGKHATAGMICGTLLAVLVGLVTLKKRENRKFEKRSVTQNRKLRK